MEPLTTRQLITKTPSKVKARCHNIRVLGLKDFKFVMRTRKISGINKKVLYMKVVTLIKGWTDNYDEFILVPVSLDGMRKNLMHGTPYVYCSCPFFKFNCAYVLLKHKNLVAKADLGEALKKPPIVRNPMMIPQVCKHILVNLKYIQSKSVRQFLSLAKSKRKI